MLCDGQRNGSCVADVIKPRLIKSAKQRRDPCSDPQRT